MKLHYYFWIFTPLILIFAYLDMIIFSHASLLGYILICSVEYGLFWVGMYSGYNIKCIELKK